MKRIVVILLITLGIAAGAFLAARDWLAGALARRALDVVVEASARRGMTISEVSWRGMRFAGFSGIVCDGLQGKVRAQVSPVGPGGLHLDFRAGQVVFSIVDFSSGEVEMRVVDGAVEALDRDGNREGTRLSPVTARVRTTVEWSRPARAVDQLGEDLRRLVREGRSGLFLQIDAVARFKVGQRWHEVDLHSGRDAGDSIILLEHDDVRQISRGYVQPLTETEIDLVARHPVRAPALLRLSEQASDAAEGEGRRDRTFPVDAYRHVYWSWLLTREFGPEFSEMVTDAHEIGPTYEAGDAKRRMDLRNNAVGRAYALAGVPESELVQRVRTDPNVRRSAR